MFKTDSKELNNQYNNPEYADEVKRMHKELKRLRKELKVPENKKQDLSNVDMHYHSDAMRKRALERMRLKKK